MSDIESFNVTVFLWEENKLFWVVECSYWRMKAWFWEGKTSCFTFE